VPEKGQKRFSNPRDHIFLKTISIAGMGKSTPHIKLASIFAKKIPNALLLRK
jgi:hypothetical protein